MARSVLWMKLLFKKLVKGIIMEMNSGFELLRAE
jgi:hypothetical protein